MTDTKYNYREEVSYCVRDYVREMLEDGRLDSKDWQYIGARYDLEEKLHDDMWAEDSVTGNGSGSYTFNTWKAEEYLCHNLDLLAEACEYAGFDVDILKDGAEACDVTIRCYLLGWAISDLLDEMEEEGFFDEEEERS